MTINAAGPIEVHVSQRAVLIHADKPRAPLVPAVVSASQADRYPYMRNRVFPDADTDGTGPDTAEPGLVTVSAFLLDYIESTDFGGGGLPVLYSASSVYVPQNANGIIYLIVGLRPFDVSIEYGLTLPAPASNVFVRTLANVTRGSDASAPVAIRQRCFGLIAIPPMDSRSGTQGLFG